MLLRTQPCHQNKGLHSSGHNSCHVRCTAAVLPQATQLPGNTFLASALSLRCNASHLTGRSAVPLSSGSKGSSSSRCARSAGVICRDSPTWPMWRAPDPLSGGGGGDLARMITQKLTDCRSLVDLSNIYDEWGGNFDFIHAATAIRKYALNSKGSGSELLRKLLRCWLQQLPLAGEQACANVLWALGRLGTRLDDVWVRTFEAYLRLAQQGLQDKPVKPQSMENVLWACAKLHKPPAPDQLQVLMQAVLLPEVLAVVKAQDLSNIVWALGRMSRMRAWKGGVSEADIRQLLGQQKLQLVAATGAAQTISNLLVGLTDLSSGSAPIISKPFAQQCSKQLLAGTAQKIVSSGNSQNVCNAMWACGELGLADAAYLSAAAAAAARWVPSSFFLEVVQAATACAKLQLRHQGLMAALLRRGQQVVDTPSLRRPRRTSP